MAESSIIVEWSDCGDLTADARHVIELERNPEFLAGLCGLTVVRQLSDCPAKGPAPLSTWGFSLAKRFLCGLSWNGVNRLNCVGIQTQRDIGPERVKAPQPHQSRFLWPQWRERSIGRAVAASMETTPVQQNDMHDLADGRPGYPPVASRETERGYTETPKGDEHQLGGLFGHQVLRTRLIHSNVGWYTANGPHHRPFCSQVVLGSAIATRSRHKNTARLSGKGFMDSALTPMNTGRQDSWVRVSPSKGISND